MSYTVSKAIDAAESKLGYREKGDNDTMFNRWLGKIPSYPHNGYGYPWCQSFQSWVADQAGGRANVDYPRTAGCETAVGWFRRKGRFYRTPRVGDQVFFGPRGGTHVELVVKVEGNYFVSIGGNTSGTWKGNYANGDGVYRKRRAVSSAYGFGRPFYDGTGSAGGSRSSSGASTNGMSSVRSFRSQQEAVNDQGYSPKLVVDGIWGPKTEAGVKWLQKRLGVEADGLWGPNTERAYKATSGSSKGSTKVTVPSGSPLIKTNSKGTRVKQLQQALMAAGEKLPKYKADGIFGTETMNAVKSFQRKSKLSVDGIYGPKTSAALKKKLKQ